MSILKLNVKRAPVMSRFIEGDPFSYDFKIHIGSKLHIPNIAAISGALFTLGIHYEYTQAQ